MNKPLTPVKDGLRKRLISRIARRIGLDNGSAQFAYARDARFGMMNQGKVPEQWVKTTCGYCSVGCGMLIGVRKGKAISVKGDPEHPVNQGKLCPKGLSEHQTIHAPGRLRTPLVGSWRGLRPTDWESALDTFVTRVKGVQEAHGADSFAVLSTGQMVHEEFYTLGKLVQLGLGTRSYDGNTTLCMASAVAGYKRSFGNDGPPGCYEDLEKADTVMLIGANVADNHPILVQRLIRNREHNPRHKLVVVDPRATKTAMMADLFLAVRPRADVHLLNGLAKLVIDEGWADQRYVEKNTEGYEALCAQISHYSLEYTAKVTGLTEGQIYETAKAIGQARSATLAWTMGVNHSTQGAETVNAICNLALLTGNVGIEGGTALSITGQCNAMGSREASFTSSLPGYRKFESAEHRRELAEIWKIDPEKIPSSRGPAYPDIIEAILEGKIKGLWVIATNPLVSYPDQGRLREALKKLDFLVVQDGYHPTPTTELADLVLPAAIWGEKEGCYTNSERRVSRVRRAVSPPGEARSDFDIFLAIAEKLGVKDALFPDWKGPGDAFEEWRLVSRGRPCDYSGMSHALLDAHSLQWPFTEGSAVTEATPRLYQEGRFETPDGRARLWPIRSRRPPEEPCQEYPFMLNTGRTVEHWHTRTKTGRVAILEGSAPEAWCEINPRDAKQLGVRNHDRLCLQSRRGRVDGLRARVTSIVSPGQVFVPFHFEETNANQLTLDEACPISREPNFKQAAVRVSRQGVTPPSAVAMDQGQGR